MSIQDFLWIIKNKILTILVFTLLATVTGVYQEVTKLPTYETTTTIMVSGKDDNSVLAYQPLTKTFAEIAKSYEVSKEVAKAVSGVSIEDIQDKISIQTIPDTSLIKIVVFDTDKYRAATIADATGSVTKDTLKKLLKSDVVKILEKASIPETPILPNKGVNTATGTFFGLIIGIAYVLIRESFANNILTVQDIRKKLNLPVIGIIAKDIALRVGKNHYFTPEQLPTVRNPKSEISQAFRMIRTNITNLLKGQESMKTLLVTSATEGEGKTIIAANLAISMTKLGQEVILVDCNLNGGSQASLFKLRANVGLVNFLNDELVLDETIQESHVEGLKIVTTGPAFNTDEALTSKKFSELIKQLSGKVDLVIIDAPAINASADAVILCGIVDKVLFVLKKGTPLEKVKKALNSLKFYKANILGCVMNREDRD